MCYQNHSSIPPISTRVLGKAQRVFFQGFKVQESKSPRSDFSWPGMLRWVQSASGLRWAKLGPAQFRPSQTRSVNLNFWRCKEREERLSVPLQGPLRHSCPKWSWTGLIRRSHRRVGLPGPAAQPQLSGDTRAEVASCFWKYFLLVFPCA